MAKISKKEALYNNLVCNVIIAEQEYTDGLISEETLIYMYKAMKSTVRDHCDKEFRAHWENSRAVNRIKKLLESA